MRLQAIAVSRDGKWIICGAYNAGASVWDGETQEKVIHVEGEDTVDAVDVSPDSTSFATATRGEPGEASIWSIPAGRRLVGPLIHATDVDDIRFSPNGEHIATACGENIRIFDSQTGDILVTINADLPTLWGAIRTTFAWSSDGRQIFAVSNANYITKIRAFDTSTGTALAESQELRDSGMHIPSIALAPNGKLIATHAYRSISFLDTSTLARIGPVIEDDEQIRSIAISPDSTRLATARVDGKIAIRDLRKILPFSYAPTNVRICPLCRSISHINKICRYLFMNEFKRFFHPRMNHSM